MVRSDRLVNVSVEKIPELDTINLVEIVRRCKSREKIEVAYSEIVSRIKSKIYKISLQFYIPGLSQEDVYQESLYALRYKAIKDYNKDRGKGDEPFPFDRFAMICIRRHLSTQRKSSYQNKRKVLNTSISLNKERSDPDGEIVFLSEILPKTDGTVIESVGEDEYIKTLLSKLYERLSELEKEVFVLYAQRYSYEDMAKIINKQKNIRSTNIKSIDNALSRIKLKAKEIFDKFGDFDDHEHIKRQKRRKNRKSKNSRK